MYFIGIVINYYIAFTKHRSLLVINQSLKQYGLKQTEHVIELITGRRNKKGWK